MFTRIWLVAALTRALRTFGQVFAALLPVTAVTLGGVNWAVVLSGAALAAVASLATSLAGLPEATEPGITDRVTLTRDEVLEANADTEAADNDPTGFPYV